MRRPWAVLGCLLGAGLAGACETPTVPLEVDPYDFRLQVPAGMGQTSDVKTFHWPKGSSVDVILVGEALPNRPSLRTAFESAVRIWGVAAVFGEVALRETTDPGRALVILTWDDAEPRYSTPASCTGPTTGAAATRGCLTDDGQSLRVWARRDGGGSRALFRVTINRSLVVDAEFLQILVAHEMGHALGILSHSPDSGDLMWGGPLDAPDLSEADRVTLRSLYQAEVDLGIPPPLGGGP